MSEDNLKDHVHKNLTSAKEKIEKQTDPPDEAQQKTLEIIQAGIISLDDWG